MLLTYLKKKTFFRGLGGDLKLKARIHKALLFIHTCLKKRKRKVTKNVLC